MEYFMNLFDNSFLTIIGGVATIAGLITLFLNFLSWTFGITPIILKFGNALRSRKIGVFGTPEAHSFLCGALQGSSLFKKENIIRVNAAELSKGKNCSIYLIDWKSCENKIDEIFQQRANEQVAVIIFAEPGGIDRKVMSKVANRDNTVVVNFKGRLLNDVLTSLVTTSYGK